MSLCGTRPGWLLANLVSAVVWSKEEAEACVCRGVGDELEEGGGLEMGFEGQRIST